MVAQFARLGVVVERDQDDEPEGVPVWPENWEALLVFLGCTTQWRAAPAGLAGVIMYFGLDYPAVDVLLRGRNGRDAIFADLRVMEAAALPILNAGDAS